MLRDGARFAGSLLDVVDHLPAPDPHAALYRRFRPQRFADLVGQDHVSTALLGALQRDQVRQAYLFVGPRGCGKTTTARLLAKALNCDAPEAGEPCNKCESCLSITAGISPDVTELDAASNRKLEDIREIVSLAALSPMQKRRVLILDEVHRLDRHAVPALLKTLEEPPSHAVFVLATTDPQEVLPTIKSRTQQFEFRLLDHAELRSLVDEVNNEAELGLDDAALEAAVHKGRGSARDTLSALDQIAASGGLVIDFGSQVRATIEGLAERDPGVALGSLSRGLADGLSPRAFAEELIGELRTALLLALAPSAVTAAADDVERLTAVAKRLGPPALTRAIDALGVSMAEMRDALDPRIPLEVAVVRVTSTSADTSLAGIAARVNELERTLASGVPTAATPGEARAIAKSVAESARLTTVAIPMVTEPVARASATAIGTPEVAEPLPTRDATGPSAARAALGALAKSTPRPAATPKAVAPEPVPQPAAAAVAATAPAPSPKQATAVDFTRETLTKLWVDELLGRVDSGARGRFRAGRWVRVDGDTAVFAVPATFVKPCTERKQSVEEVLSARFGRVVTVKIEADGADSGAPVQADAADDEVILDAHELSQLREVKSAVSSPEDMIKRAFPGAEEVAPS